MRAIFLLLAAAGSAFGQLDPDTITIGASRTIPAQYNVAAVQVQLSLPQTSTLDDALAIVNAAGFTAGDFTGVSSPTTFVLNPLVGTLPQLPVYWTLSKTVSTGDVPAILAALDRARNAMLQGKSGTDLLYSVSNATPPAPDCQYPALIGNAQAQAARVASAAGLKAGSIISIAEGGQTASVPVAAFRSGDFGVILPAGQISYATFLLGRISSVPPATGCSITVQFRLIR